MDSLLHKALSVPSFDHYGKQLIGAFIEIALLKEILLNLASPILYLPEYCAASLILTLLVASFVCILADTMTNDFENSSQFIKMTPNFTFLASTILLKL